MSVFAGRLIDIGANLTDKVFFGMYRGRQRHENDFSSVLTRAFDAGLEKIIVTAGSLSDTKEAIELCGTNPALFCTAGCHPTRCQEMQDNPIEYLNNLKALILEHPDKVVAVGECGLDYDRKEFCPPDVQRKYFEEQLKLASVVGRPLFLHCRAAHDDFFELVKKAIAQFYDGRQPPGVVHTFDGTQSEAQRLLNLGFYLGVNGCSLKTEENLKVVKSIPIDRLLLETDAPWCEVRPSHAGFQYVKTHPKIVRNCDRWQPGCMVKGRNEPANIVQVLEVVASLKDMSTEELANQVYANTTKLFAFSQ